MFPIVLAHGIARFDVLREKLDERLGLPDNPLEDEFQYFKNIRTHLGKNSFPSVFNTNVNFAGSVELRAEQLKNRVGEIIAETGAEKVHIIAHSMGGLDARRMIVDLEYGRKSRRFDNRRDAASRNDSRRPRYQLRRKSVDRHFAKSRFARFGRIQRLDRRGLQSVQYPGRKRRSEKRRFLSNLRQL